VVGKTIAIVLRREATMATFTEIEPCYSVSSTAVVVLLKPNYTRRARPDFVEDFDPGLRQSTRTLYRSLFTENSIATQKQYSTSINTKKTVWSGPVLTFDLSCLGPAL